MPTIQSHDCAINVVVEGREDAPALVLSNSLGADLSMWDPQANDLARHFRLIRYDRRGHGKSGAPRGPYSIEMLGRDVLAVLDALKIEKASWCGISMGGMVGQWLAANASHRFARMIFSNCTDYYPDPSSWDDRIRDVRAHGLASIADATMERWFTRDFRERRPEVIATLVDKFVATKIEGYIGCCQALRNLDNRALLPKIDRKVLIVAGRYDPATTVAQAESMANRIAGAELKIVETAHIPNIELGSRYTDIMLDFLRG